MDTKPDLLYLERKTTQTLHDRFSEVMMEQLTQSKILLKSHQRSMVLRLPNIPRSQARSRITSKGLIPKACVWARIGWYSPWRRGVWNFRNKYCRRVCLSSACWSKLSPSTRVSPTPSARFSPAPCTRFRPTQSSRFVVKSRFILTPKQKPVWSRLGRASVAFVRHKCVPEKAPPTKKQLDLELDQYMSKTKSHLNQQLEDYMSLSRRRLDAELDQYMAMAGQAEEASS